MTGVQTCALPIYRLQQNCGGAEFNNMYADCNVEDQPRIDYVAHAGSMGAHAVKATGIADLEAQIAAARDRPIPTVIVIDTTAKDGPAHGLTDEAGHWWDVAVPAVGDTPRLREAYQTYLENAARARLVN